MAIYPFKIVGVHYAVNPESSASAEETELMHQRTAQRLDELDKMRPPVVLIPEPTNPADARAVMARVRGARIGYVDKTQLDIIHAIFATNGGCPLKARIESVEARKHGWMDICVETNEEVCIESPHACDGVWEQWVCHLPTLPVIESQFVMMEAEVMLEDALNEGAIDTVEHYIRLWMENSLHDLSNEARLMREHYIERLKEMTPQNGESSKPLPRIRALVSELEKQRTAICGQKRTRLRTEVWWKELMQSKEMEQLWKTWQTRIGENLEQGANELGTPLKALPCDLYALIGDKKLFVSRLHYSQGPRTTYWQVVSLMLLHDCMQKELKAGGSETEPPIHRDSRWMAEAPNETFAVTIPKELQSPEAKKILVKLQKKGLLDADLQPVGLSAAKKGVLAWELCDFLGIKTCWKTMGILWKCKGETIRKARDKGIMTDAVIEFTKKLKAIIY